MSEACLMLFAKFYLSELLLLVAVVTAYYASIIKDYEIVEK